MAIMNATPVTHYDFTSLLTIFTGFGVNMFFQLFGVPGIDVLTTDAQIATHEALHRIWVGMLSNLDCRVLAFGELGICGPYDHGHCTCTYGSKIYCDATGDRAFVSVFKL